MLSSSSMAKAMGASSASAAFVILRCCTVISVCQGLVPPPFFAHQPSSPHLALVEPLPIVQYFPSSAYAGAWHADPRGGSPPDPTRTTQGYPYFAGVAPSSSSSSSSSRPSRPVMDGVREWLVPSAQAAEPPTEADVKLLREAYNTFYGERDPVKAEPLLTNVIQRWDLSGQPADERAALYRIRANCRMLLFRPADALADYDETIRLLEGPGGDAADPSEVPEAYLGRARALRSRGMGDVAGGTTGERAARAAADYGRAVRLLSRDDWDSDAELEEDGSTRNPYAAYEWGTALRVAGDPRGAARVHGLADDAFDLVGDSARSVISGLDAGIDLAATGDVGRATGALERAIKRTTSVEGRDVALLQRVIAKEGEARIALASVLWSSGDRPGAEGQLGEACLRLDQLDADAAARSSGGGGGGGGGGGVRERKAAAMVKTVGGELPTLGFSIDDLPGAGEVSCSRFKNAKFLTETLGWPEELQVKVKKLQSLGR